MPDSREVRYFAGADPIRKHRAARVLSQAVDLLQGAADTLEGDGRDVGLIRDAASDIMNYLERMRRWGA